MSWTRRCAGTSMTWTRSAGSDAWIDQRFLVLDGPLAGECVAFVADRPGLHVSWVPDAIAPDEAGKQRQAPTTQMTGPPQALRMNVQDTCRLRSSTGPSES
jgi:hypothetical protein